MGSLFGDNSSLHGSTIFGSEPITRNSDAIADPWANATPASVAPSSSASSLLNGTDVPEVYRVTFEDALKKVREANPKASKTSVPVSALNDLFALVPLSLSTRAKIYSLINVPPYDPNHTPEAASEIDRGTWYVAVALAAFSQKGSADQNLSLSLVDFSRNSLPHITIAKYQPQLRKDDSHSLSNGSNVSNTKRVASASGLTGGGVLSAPNGSLIGTVWESPVNPSNYNPLSPNTISVSLVPKREGTLFFRHVNYIIEGVLPNSVLSKGVSGKNVNGDANGTSSFKVIRRYSDFDWLLDILQRKYPFRLLPILPPKSLTGMFYLFILHFVLF